MFLAVRQEVEQQKLTFLAQQKEYLSRKELVSAELDLLKFERRELGNSKNPDVQKMIAENSKRQVSFFLSTLKFGALLHFGILLVWVCILSRATQSMEIKRVGI